jgi:hypothetical protein
MGRRALLRLALRNNLAATQLGSGRVTGISYGAAIAERTDAIDPPALFCEYGEVYD